MKIKVLRDLKGVLTLPAAREAWCDIVELRQRLYGSQSPYALILDKYDLIADHIVLYSDTGTAMAYVRSVTSLTCSERRQPLPIEAVVSALPERLSEHYRQFVNARKIAANMSYLCLDQGFRPELKGIKIIDLMTWFALRASGHPFDSLAYCATPNMKYKLREWLEKLGTSISRGDSFVHPVVPEPHELVLIPEIRAEYWREKAESYAEFWDNAEWIVPAEGLDRAA